MISRIRRKNAFFGGTATALNFFDSFLIKCSDDMNAKIIVTDAKPSANSLKRFNAYKVVPMSIDDDFNRQLTFLNADDPSGLVVNENDTFITKLQKQNLTQ